MEGRRSSTRAASLLKAIAFLLFLVASTKLPCQASRSADSNKTSRRLQKFFAREIFKIWDVPITLDMVADHMNSSKLFGKVKHGDLYNILRGYSLCATVTPDDILRHEEKESWERFYFVHDWFSVNQEVYDDPPETVINRIAGAVVHLWRLPCAGMRGPLSLAPGLPKKQMMHYFLLMLMAHRAMVKWLTSSVERSKDFTGRELLYILLLHYLAIQSPDQFQQIDNMLRNAQKQRKFKDNVDLTYFGCAMRTLEVNRLRRAFRERNKTIKVKPLGFDMSVAIPRRYGTLNELIASYSDSMKGFVMDKPQHGDRVTLFLPCHSHGHKKIVDVQGGYIEGDIYVYKYTEPPAQTRHLEGTTPRYYEKDHLPEAIREDFLSLPENLRDEIWKLAPRRCTSKEGAEKIGPLEDFYVVKKSTMRKMIKRSGAPALEAILSAGAVGVLGIFAAIGLAFFGFPILTAIVGALSAVILGGTLVAAVIWKVIIVMQDLLADLYSVVLKRMLPVATVAVRERALDGSGQHAGHLELTPLEGEGSRMFHSRERQTNEHLERRMTSLAAEQLQVGKS